MASLWPRLRRCEPRNCLQSSLPQSSRKHLADPGLDPRANAGTTGFVAQAMGPRVKPEGSTAIENKFQANTPGAGGAILRCTGKRTSAVLAPLRVCARDS